MRLPTRTLRASPTCTVASPSVTSLTTPSKKLVVPTKSATNSDCGSS